MANNNKQPSPPSMVIPPPQVFSIPYRKTKPFHTLKSSMEQEFHMQQLQQYHPLYSLFFVLNATNENNIMFHHRYQCISSTHVLDTRSNEIQEKDIYIKYSPLLDPIRYAVGKYPLNDPRLQTLPRFHSTTETCHEKYLSIHNSSYVDGFFYFVVNQLMEQYPSFVHGIQFYGSFLGFQNEFHFNVEEDLEYFSSSDFFQEHLGKIMVLKNVVVESSSEEDDKHHATSLSFPTKEKLTMMEYEEENHLLMNEVLGMVGIMEEESFPTNEGTTKTIHLDQKEEEELQETNSMIFTSSEHAPIMNLKSLDSSSPHSSSMHTSTPSFSETYDDDPQEEDDHEDDQESVWEDMESTTNTTTTTSSWDDLDEEAQLCIFHFPVQMICLETCQGTLDELFEQEIATNETAPAFLFQIVMTLLLYQQLFHFTHNDLHTNNIMYTTTEETHVWYRYHHQLYCVPTYGYIFKIIDFGRSIYQLKGHVFCSDSFAPGGDAYSQYNCPPFENPDKPTIPPNMSFDLCRLGCSIYDFLFDTSRPLKSKKKMNTLETMIYTWCCDDHGKNILYSQHHQHERYPGFLLYKMIARTVHHHTPEKQLSLPWTQPFHVTLSSSSLPPSPDKVIDLDIMIQQYHQMTPLP